MEKLNLVHFVEWKKISDDDFILTVEKLVDWGVRDIVAHPQWGIRDAQAPGYLKSVARKFELAGVRTPACHALWGKAYDISSCSAPENTERIVMEHSVFLKKLAQMNVKTYTMHIGMEDNGETPWEYIRKALDRLLPVASDCKIILALENGHENLATQRELAELVDSYQHPYLGICFDTGHANCYGDQDWRKSLKILSKNIVTCHLHDNYGTFDDHNPPGKGNLDWKELTGKLKNLPRMLHAETESGEPGEESWKLFCKVWNN
jgi:sugar phosphate isomerase/epimerase